MKKTLKDIASDAASIFKTNWSRRKGQVVPISDSVQLGNEAVEIEAAVLYADLASSTALVLGHKDYFAAEVIKSFLLASCNVIRNNSGEIVSFDGDRVMGVFIGDKKCSNAAKAGLQITSAIREVNKSLKDFYSSTSYIIDYAIGIDVSDLFIIRTGIRGSNDLSWVGTAANIAAKLSELRGRSEKVFVTDKVYKRMADSSKYGGKNNECMWSDLNLNIRGNKIYGSEWYWNF